MKEILSAVRDGFCVGLWMGVPIVLVGLPTLGLVWLFGSILKSLLS